MNPALFLYIAIVALAGAAVAMQPAFNGQLSAQLGSPLRAALVSFAAGASIMLVLTGVLALRQGLPSAEQIARVPAHLWVVGGALGTLFVTTAAWTAPKIGTGAFFAVLFTAQLIAAIALDHFGLIGLETRPVTLTRIAGAGLLIAGAILVVRG